MDSFGYNTGYIEELYTQYLEDPETVSESWREFFADYQPGESFVAPAEARAGVSGNGEVAPAEPEPARPQAREKPRPEKPARVEVSAEKQAQESEIRGVAARIVDNMEASLSIPTATSARQIPVKLMAENRRLINDYQRTVGGDKVSFTHIIAWAIVQALKAYPSMNSSFRQDNGKPLLVQAQAINLGLAIDVERRDGSRSLLVPNVKNVQDMSFAQFLGSYNDIVRRARDGNLDLSDFEGTTLTLTNPGMIGTIMSVPRLMTGQGLIVAVGAIGYPHEFAALAHLETSKIGLSEVMTITSTYDHRVIQGAESGEFLSRIAGLLQGQHQFYFDLFGDLGVPYQPFAFSTDTTPFLGHGEDVSDQEVVRKQAKVLQLVRAYRVRGHLLADLNPLGHPIAYHPELDPANYDLTIWDLDRKFITGDLGGQAILPLRDILTTLRETYCRKVGIEYMHISDPMERRWLQERIEPVQMCEPLSLDQKRRILYKLNAAEAFERFLHTKYVGHKRFSLEGAETVIPILDMILTDAADQEVDEVVIGMAHRGRLNVLANTLIKPYRTIFSEFEGSIDPRTTQGSGDVKYHLGSRGVHEAPGGASVNVTLASNPSHLEAVDPVVEGMVRAKQEVLQDMDRDAVIPLLIHGDAAFAGQGVVAETLNLSQLRGYKTGGTIHIVINNQIGFTTAPQDARSSTYATDIARMIQAPIFHVNGDDPEACVRVARLALDYRQVFNKDVVIDMICYRQHGHNEGDEPSYTQPVLYQKIQEHRSTRKVYTEALLRRGDMNPDEAEQMLDDYQERLQEAFEDTKELSKEQSPERLKKKLAAREARRFDDQNGDTSAGREDLEAIVRVLTEMPDDLGVHPKLMRQIERRAKQFFEDEKVDWALAEALAFGSLLLEGKAVRLSGQDSRRGTFSQRHSVIYDQETGAEYIPLNNIREGQQNLQVFDSLLSEYAVLGFEYGYSVADPRTLVIWEAQFGDFVNGGQITIDQFISAAEAKWGQNSGLVMLLPHGYEGQGPEHSSARLERFLMACAENNMVVCNFSTPANFFHALRRQMNLEPAKPLVVMAPKSLLRHPRVISHPDDFVSGRFYRFYPAPEEAGDAKRLILCSGKVYYDLLQAMDEHDVGQDKVAIARVEQFYPFPKSEIREELERFRDAQEVFWVQEEPSNMGAWWFMKPAIDELLEDLHGKCEKQVRYIGRPASASTATGSARIHALEQERLIKEALGVS